jgi:lysophospholipase L1-like esterase
MKRNSAWISIFLSLLFFFSCKNEDYLAFTNKVKSLAGKKEVTIVIFGDTVSSTESSFTGSTYASFLKPKLEKLLNTRISLINSSKPEETVEKATRRIQEDVQSYRPDIVFIMLGMEDANQPGLYEQVYEENAANLFRILKREEVFAVVLSSPGYRDWATDDDDPLVRLREFNDITLFQASLAHLPAIDLAAYMNKLRKTKPDEYRSMFQDNFRLNEKGQNYVADFLCEQVRLALESK